MGLIGRGSGDLSWSGSGPNLTGVSTSKTAILLLSGPDRPGLVAAVSGFVAEHGGNAVHTDQHTDPEEQLFLQRVEFELDGFDLGRDEIGPKFGPLAERLGLVWTLNFSDARPRTAILVSKLGHCLYDLLARWRLGELRMEVPVVLSNHPDLESVARDFGVPYRCLPVAESNRGEQEAQIAEVIESEQIDLIVLARYMQVLGPGLVERFGTRTINIHHSFLPAFAGARPYHQAHRRGVKIIGATAHYVTEDLDQGPIIEQNVVRVSHRNRVSDMIRKGRDLEKVVLARAVGLHLESRVIVYRNKTVVFD